MTTAAARDIHIFAGPTLSHEQVLSILPQATVHGPVAHGDLLALDLAPGDVVAMIDGVFFQVGAVRHKEILAVMDEGVMVVGCSSMGALRAAELHTAGMIGSGLVFRLYRSGVIERDDEVAIAHSDQEHAWRPLTEALITIRLAARRARRCGQLSSDGERLIIDVARRRHFMDRHLASVLDEASAMGLDDDQRSTFSARRHRQEWDAKRADAVGMLEDLSRTLPVAAPQRRAPATSFVEDWRRMFRGMDVGGVRISDDLLLLGAQLFGDDYPTWASDILLEDVLRREQPSSAEAGTGRQDALHGMVSARGLSPADGRLHPGLAAWLRPGEADLSLDEALPRVVVRSYRWGPGIRVTEPLISSLLHSTAAPRLRSLLGAAVGLADELAARSARFHPDRISSDRITSWFEDRWGPNRLVEEIADRGFLDEEEMVARARPLFPYAWLHGVAPISLRDTRTDHGRGLGATP